MKKEHVLYVINFLIVFALYYITGKYGLDLNDRTGHVNLIWIPAGLGLAAVLIHGYRMLPAIFLGIVAVSIARHAPLYPSLWIIAASVLEPLLGAYLLRKMHFHNSFDTISDVTKLALVVAPFISFLSAIPGVLSLILYRPHVTLSVTSLTWWSGHFVGILIVTSLLLVWNKSVKIDLNQPKRIVELYLVYLSVFLYGFIIFTPFLEGPNKSSPTSYMAFLPVLWAVFRFDLRTVVTVVSAVSLVIIAGFIHGTDLFVYHSPYETSISLKSFLMIFSITSLLTGVALSERRRYEQRKDNFISIASHELRTPLTTIKVVTQLLQRMHAEDKDGKEKKYLKDMDQQINKMTHLIRDMLDLSKIQAGRLQLEEEKFALEPLIKQTVESMQTIASNHKISMEGKFTGKVNGDKERIGQVFMNLLSNAIKYSPEKSDILVHGVAEKRNIILSVEDHGMGIPKAQLQKIFERFYRVNGEKHKDSGFGLGLYISAEIIKQHQGEIWVESKEGKGSKFYIRLPLV
jgi:signal transduction histidine kinase